MNPRKTRPFRPTVAGPRDAVRKALDHAAWFRQERRKAWLAWCAGIPTVFPLGTYKVTRRVLADSIPIGWSLPYRVAFERERSRVPPRGHPRVPLLHGRILGERSARVRPRELERPTLEGNRRAQSFAHIRTVGSISHLLR